MTKSALPKPIIMHLPYQSIENRVEIEKALSESCGDVPLSVVERSTLHYLFDYPTVYVVHSEKRNKDTGCFEYTVYVGETNNIHNRAMQHLRNDSKIRDDWKEFHKRLQKNPRSVWQYVIGNAHFNKSLTLDVENRLMHYLLGSNSVKTLNNRRTNAQGDYYTQDEFEQIFSDI
nr:GIY-YIG nuclease family protein [Bifidobacterium pseudocatenulatum]